MSRRPVRDSARILPQGRSLIPARAVELILWSSSRSTSSTGPDHSGHAGTHLPARYAHRPTGAGASGAAVTSPQTRRE